MSLHIQLVFFLLIFSRLNWYNDPKSKEGESNYRGVSVIVPAHNELFNLQNLIPVLLKQNYPNFEIIIVNDRSIDGTSDYLDRNYVFHPIVKTLHITQKEAGVDPKKMALTSAIQAAENEILLITDADCLPKSEFWIREMTAPLQGKKQMVLGFSSYIERPGLLNKLIRYETLYTGIQYLSLSLAGQTYMGVGRNIAYTKTLFWSQKGFKSFEHITGGDDDLFVQHRATINNVAIKISSESHTVSYPKTTWKEWYVQKTRHLSVGKYYKGKHRFLLGFLTASHFAFYITLAILLINGSWPKIGIIGYALRTLLLIFIFTGISKKLEVKLSAISLPLLDVLNLINYMVVGIKAVVSRNIKWR